MCLASVVAAGSFEIARADGRQRDHRWGGGFGFVITLLERGGLRHDKSEMLRTDGSQSVPSSRR